MKAEIQATKQELAAAELAGNTLKVDFLRKEVLSLREQQTILLRAQAPGQFCLQCHKLTNAPDCARHVRIYFHTVMQLHHHAWLLSCGLSSLHSHIFVQVFQLKRLQLSSYLCHILLQMMSKSCGFQLFLPYLGC